MSIFIIAELGINHNGNVEIAKQLIDVAKEAGCDAVKFQKRTIELVYSPEELDKPLENPWGNTKRDQKLGLELGQKDYEQIDEYCRKREIDWFASAWDIESQKFLQQFNLKYNKVASAMLVDIEHLARIAAEGKHTFISTGMSTYNDIDIAVDIFRKNKCPFELMHCVAIYPMDDVDANLNCIPIMKKRYQCDVGYSGHEVGLAVSYAAAALGISSLERHITLNRSMYGSDQAASVEPAGLRILVGAVRKIEKAMGNGKKEIIKKELPIAKKLRSHLKWESSE